MYVIMNYKKADIKRLIDNFISLLLLQGANYILPLLTVPYLVRVLGPEKYGLIAFAQALIQYFIIITDYGFNLSATRKISIVRENKLEVSRIVSNVFCIKIGLAIICFFVLSICVMAVPCIRTNPLLYLISFGMVIGNICFPTWFFQGVEKMRYITFLNIFAKLVFTIAVFILVKGEQDFILVPLVNSLGYLSAGIVSLFFLLTKFKVTWQSVSLQTLSVELKDGWHIFLSTAAISLYTASNTFILGLLTNDAVVGYYSAGEKIVKAFQGLLSPLSQAIYPYVNKLAAESPVACLRWIQKLFYLLGSFGLILSVFLFICADTIVNVVLGAKYLESIYVIRILALIPFVVALSNVLGIQTMLTFKYNQLFSKILIFAGVVNVSLTFLIVPIYQHIGTSVAVVTTESFVTITMLICLKIKGINVIKGCFSKPIHYMKDDLG